MNKIFETTKNSLIKIPWTNPAMTSTSNAEGYLIDSNYTMNGATWVGIDMWTRVLNNGYYLFIDGGSYSSLIIPSGKNIYLKEIVVTMSSGPTVYEQSRYGTFTLYKNNTVVLTLSTQRLPNGGGTISIPVPDVLFDKIKVSELIASDNILYDGGNHAWAGSVVLNGYEFKL